MPALILDEKEKQVARFISSNGLVEDPYAIEKIMSPPHGQVRNLQEIPTRQLHLFSNPRFRPCLYALHPCRSRPATPRGPLAVH